MVSGAALHFDSFTLDFPPLNTLHSQFRLRLAHQAPRGVLKHLSTFHLSFFLFSNPAAGRAAGYTSLTMVPASPLALPLTVPGAAMVMAVLPLLLPPPPPTLDLLRLQQLAAAAASLESNFSSSPLSPPPPLPHPPPDQILKWRNRVGCRPGRIHWNYCDLGRRICGGQCLSPPSVLHSVQGQT